MEPSREVLYLQFFQITNHIFFIVYVYAYCAVSEQLLSLSFLYSALSHLAHFLFLLKVGCVLKA